MFVAAKPIYGTDYRLSVIFNNTDPFFLRNLSSK